MRASENTSLRLDIATARAGSEDACVRCAASAERREEERKFHVCISFLFQFSLGAYPLGGPCLSLKKKKSLYNSLIINGELLHSLNFLCCAP